GQRLRTRRGRPRLLAEQREGEFVACIEQRDGVFALPGPLGDPPHLLGIGAVLHRDRLAPARGLNEGRVPIKSRGGEAAQIGRDIVGDFWREAPAMGEPARVRVAVGGQERNADHGLTPCRKSFTRTALPCERGISPGALRTTSQVTPTIAFTWWRTSAAIFAANGSSRGRGGASSTSMVMASIGPSRVSTS